jgi:hypothetical protein
MEEVDKLENRSQSTMSSQAKKILAILNLRDEEKALDSFKSVTRSRQKSILSNCMTYMNDSQEITPRHANYQAHLNNKMKSSHNRDPIEIKLF